MFRSNARFLSLTKKNGDNLNVAVAQAAQDSSEAFGVRLVWVACPT